MKKIFLSVLALVFTFAVTSCRDTERKVDENMEEEVEMMEEAEEMEDEMMYEVDDTAGYEAEDAEEAAE